MSQSDEAPAVYDPEQDTTEYELCARCDHFVHENPCYQLLNGGHFEVAKFLHMDDGEKDHDHDAEPSGIVMQMRQWRRVRPDLFIPYADGVGPNSKYHQTSIPMI